MRDAMRHLPLDPVVGPLLGDLRLELPGEAPDLRLEPDVAVVLLGYLVEAVHELRPLLELGPGVVGILHGDRDVDRLLDRHTATLGHARDALLLRLVLALVGVSAEARDHALAGLFGHSSDAAGLIDLLVDRVLDGPGDGLASLLHGPCAVAPVPDELA